MRPSCTKCARKHLAQALVLMLEANKGFPPHAWLAVGHMAEAEDELLLRYSHLAHLIRAERLKYIGSILDGTVIMVPILELIEAISLTDTKPEAAPATLEIPDALSNSDTTGN